MALKMANFPQTVASDFLPTNIVRKSVFSWNLSVAPKLDVIVVVATVAMIITISHPR